MRLHKKLAIILIMMSVLILLLATISSIWSIHYHLQLYNHQQDNLSESIVSNRLFDDHLEQALIQSAFLTFVGSLIISIIIGYFVAKKISAPLVNMKEVAEKMTSGDWNSRVKVHSKDELAQLATSLNRLAEQLSMQEQLRINMSTDVAHELRTPLSTLKSHMIALEDGIWEPTPERIHDCYEEIERLISLVTELEELNYMDSPEFTLQLEIQPLPPLIYKSYNIMSAAFKRKNVNLNVLFVPEVELKIDNNRMIQVFVNILSNALTHTGYGGQVDIKAEVKDKYILIDIHDTGTGIPTEDLPYIFERFYRGDKSRNRKSGGSGIGLAIVKTLVVAQGGSIWAENDNGAVFRLMLPISK